MDQIVRFAYRLQVTWRQDMERIIEECTQQGCNLPIERFEAACRVVARRLDGALDEGRLEEHFEDLLKAGDRLAAVFMLLPDHCSYSLQRDANGRVEAGISLSNAIKPATVHNDDEAAALLAALAAAVQSGAHGKPAVH
jgi:hypothetical protein